MSTCVQAAQVAQQKGTPTPSAGERLDEATLLSELARALGQKSVVRASWAEDDISKPAGRVLTACQAQEVVDRLRARRDIPFGYIKEDCEARAHVICEALREQGIACAKVFVSSEGRNAGFLFRGESMTAAWGAHVAALVFVRDDKTGNIGVRVLDPSLSARPLAVQDWIGLFRRKSEVTVDLTRDSQYFPRSEREAPADFSSGVAMAHAALAQDKDVLEKYWLDGEGKPARSAASRQIANAVAEALENDHLIERKLQPLLKNPVVTEAAGTSKYTGGRPFTKVTITYSTPSAKDADAIAENLGDAYTTEQLTHLAMNVNLPEGAEAITGRAYGNKVIFEVWAYPTRAH
jgi:hypothetical protein